MNVLSVEKLSKSFGETTLFRDISFGLEQGQKAALIARNGTGKTTLLRILAGQETPDSGQVSFRKGLRILYVEQEPKLDPDRSILQTALDSDAPVPRALAEYETALNEQSENPSPAAEARLNRALEQMEQLKAWDFEAQVRQILGVLGLDRVSQQVSTLSGGQKKRLALASALVHEPDFLILDEPTNHLDIDMIEWLEQYLSRSRLTLLLVTHDRYFLDRICSVIFEMEDETLYAWQGNYEYFLEQKTEREAAAASNLERTKNLFRRELDWMRRQPKARTTKSKARQDSFREIEEQVSNRKADSELTLDVRMTRIGSKIADMKKVRKHYGETCIIRDFSYTYKKGERVGIVGPNGVGKSTFLRLLLGLEEPDNGKIELGETIVPGYFRQEGLQYRDDQRVIDVVKEIAEVMILSDGTKVSASQLLQHFQFDYPRQQTHVHLLSGGEKRRLHLLTVLAKHPNLLILDEPTNDLDLVTLNILEEFLERYAGCLIIVSHDRYFLDKLVDHLFVFEGRGEIKDFPGNYRQWHEHKQSQPQEQRVEAVPAAVEAAPRAAAARARKLSFNEQKEYRQLEAKIEKLENRKAELADLMSAGADFAQLQNWSQELETLMSELESSTDRWLELSEWA